MMWFFLLLVLVPAGSVAGGNVVRRLPGFDGDLPFKLETGYLSVDEVQLFYYFVESEGNPNRDPLFLWLTGGPGCSSFSGLIYQAGPLEFNLEGYAGGLPKLRYYPYGRTKISSIIFLDVPVGTGFSYSTTERGWESSDSISVHQSYQFLLKWLAQHPQYASVPFFVAGDSYAGLIVPMVAKMIADGNRNAGDSLTIDLKGYVEGCPLTDLFIDLNSRVPMAHRFGIITDELYENAKVSCNENYVEVNDASEECKLALADIEECMEDVNKSDFSQHNCEDDYLNHKGIAERPLGECPSLMQCDSNLSMNMESTFCTEFRLLHNSIWANDDAVQEALHVRKESIGRWVRCNYSLSYNRDVSSVVDVHKKLTQLQLKVLVESGDHDLMVPFIGTLKWIKSMNLPVTHKWRPWYIENQVAGFTTTYSDLVHDYNLTFATVKGAGHPAPEFYRREAYHLFERWLYAQPI